LSPSADDRGIGVPLSRPEPGEQGVDLVGGMAAGGKSDPNGRSSRTRLAGPVSQRRKIEFDAFAGIDAGLAVQRYTVAEPRPQNLREQARARPAAFDRQAGNRWQHDRLACWVMEPLFIAVSCLSV
jgi:hypothetical protein